MAKGRLGRQRHGKKPRAPDWQKVGGIGLAILAAAVIVGVVIWSTVVDRPARDRETMCPEGGPSQVTAILVDTTDGLDPISRADILGRLDDLVSESRPDEMMIVYEASQSLANTFAPEITVCNPGDPDAADPLISSPGLIRRALEERFRTPLTRMFEDLVDSDEAAVSPVMETIQAISVTVYARGAYESIPKRLILISDLLQHSEHLSLYREPPDYDAFASGTGAEALQTNLRDVVLEILFVPRRAHSRLGSSIKLIRFWERWISEQGGQIERVSRIDGIN